MLLKSKPGYGGLGDGQGVVFEGGLARDKLKAKFAASELPVCVTIPVIDMFFGKGDQTVANLVSRGEHFTIDAFHTDHILVIFLVAAVRELSRTSCVIPQASDVSQGSSTFSGSII